MTSRSNYEEEREQRRYERATTASRRYLEWARRDGKRDLTVTLGLREWVIIVAVCTHHAAVLASEAGNPEILMAVAHAITCDLRELVGDDETSRLLDLVLTMLTGMEP
jgi:hypothetical protein